MAVPPGTPLTPAPPAPKRAAPGHPRPGPPVTAPAGQARRTARARRPVPPDRPLPPASPAGPARDRARRLVPAGPGLQLGDEGAGVGGPAMRALRGVVAAQAHLDPEIGVAV